jgi:signal transduction histidine kinase/CheY-like chemotaxis protein/PAS domain-containing protein
MYGPVDKFTIDNIRNICQVLRAANPSIFVDVVSVNEHGDLILPKSPFSQDIEEFFNSLKDLEMFHNSIEINGVSIHIHRLVSDQYIVVAGVVNDTFDEILKETFRFLAFSRLEIDEYIKDILFQGNLCKKVFESIPEFLAYKSVDGIYRIVSNSSNDLYKKRFDSIIGKSIDDLYNEETAKIVKALDQKVYDTGKPIRQNIEIQTDFGTKLVDTIRNPIYDDSGELAGVISVSRDISELNEVKNQLAQTNQIQSVVIDIARQFISFNEKDFDENINESLKKLGKVMEADRSYIFKYNFEQNTTDNIYEWCREGIKPQIDELKDLPVTDYLDNWVTVHRQGNVVDIPNIEMLDHETETYRSLSHQEIKSIITLPLFVNDECFGFIGFDAVNDYKDWSNIKPIIEIFPQIYANYFMLAQFHDDLQNARNLAVNANQAKTDFLAKISHEIKTPLNGIYNALYLLEKSNLDKSQSEYLGITKYSLETLTSLIDNILDFTQIETGHLKYKSSVVELEKEMISLIRLNRYAASEKNIEIIFDYDYQIPQFIHTDIQKVKQILNNLIQNAIKYTNQGRIIVKVSMIKHKDPYVDLKFEVIDTGVGISIQQKDKIFNKFYQGDQVLSKINSGVGLGLSITYELVEFLRGKLSLESKERQGTKFTVDLTIFSPDESEKEKPIDAKACLIDLSLGEDDYMSHMIKPIFNDFSLMDIKDLSHDNDYDYAFVYSNNLSIIESHMNVLEKNKKSSVKYILLYDFFGAMMSNQIQFFFDLLVETPVLQIDLLNRIQHIDKKKLTNKTNELNFDQKIIRVLLVDDNRINRKALKSILESLGLLVQEASNGYEAIDQVEKKSYDMVLMDIQMPGLDGYETTKQMRDKHLVGDHIPIIAVTAYGRDATLEAALKSGMNDTLMKPIKKEELHRILEKYIKKDDLSMTDNHQVNDTLSVFAKDDFEKLYKQPFLRLEIIDAFLEDQEEDMVRISNAFKEKSLVKIQKEIHYAKGTFAYIQAHKITKLANTILELCKKNQLKEVLNLKDMFIGYYKELISVLKDYKNQINPS